MKKFIQKILNEEKRGEYILEIPNLSFIPNADLTSPKGKTNTWNELLRLLNGKPFIFDDDLDLSYTKITSLGNLQSVNGKLDLENCKNLNSLGNLQSVNGKLDLASCENLTSLGNLKSVGRSLDLKSTNITSLGNLQSVNGYLDLYGCENLTSLGNLQSVGGSLDLRLCMDLTSLGNLRSVGDHLDLSRTPISEKYSEEEIRQMVNVKGDIYI